MRVRWIEARDFRNHREVVLQVAGGLTAVVGPNARGKTNLLEAIYYLLALESPRVSSDLPLVRQGADAAFLRGEVETATGRFLIEVQIKAGGANTVHVNRSVVRRKRDLRRHVRAVFAGPDDLAVVLGDPAERRRFMDEAVRSLWPAKEGLSAAYERVVRQRNRLLKDWSGEGEPPGLTGWDGELIAAGAALTQARAEGVLALRDPGKRLFAGVTGGEGLIVEYEPSVWGEPLEEAFQLRLAERRQDELVRRTSLVGPHRDELRLAVRGLGVRGFASHGEAWATAISLRMGLAGALVEASGEPPVTLLDDPFSGLDASRRARLAGELAGRGQVLIAVPDEIHVPPGASVWCAEESGIVPR